MNKQVEIRKLGYRLAFVKTGDAVQSTAKVWLYEEEPEWV
jgi:hypothetical protein